jgi:hypothetical protein
MIIYNDGLSQSNPKEAGPIVHRPMGLPITAGCDTAWNQTRVCRDYSSTEIQCLTPLCHSGALTNINKLARALEESAAPGIILLESEVKCLLLADAFFYC